MAQAQLHCVVSTWPIGHTCVCGKAIGGVQAMPPPCCERPFSPALLRQGGARSGNSCSSRQLTRELTPDSLPFLNFLTEVELIYNIVFISAVQQSGSVMHIWTLFFYILFHYGLLQILNIVPWAIQKDHVVYPFHV